MIERIARHEAIRVAMIGRLGLWAVILALRPRVEAYDHETLRAVAAKVLRELHSEGFVLLYTMPWLSTRPHLLSGGEIQPALAEACHWRPRQTSSRRLVRVAVTRAGIEAFKRGEFGAAAPRLSQNVFLLPEPIGAMCALEESRERKASLAAGALIGGLFGLIVATLSILVGVGVPKYFAWLFVMLGAGIGAAIAYPSEGYAGISPDEVADDEMKDSPSLDPFDRFGDPRF